MATAGKFEVKVWQSWPCPVELKLDDEVVARFDHRDLSDLHYAVGKAMQEARAELPERLWYEIDGGTR